MKYNDIISSYADNPIGISENKGIRPIPKYEYSIIACARWEEKYICEWIEYHRSIGFDHIYLYSNDDCPDAIYDRIRPYLIGDNPFVTFRHYPIIGQQYQMYFHFLRNFSTETKWMMFLDIDEFLCVKSENFLPLFMEKVSDIVDGVHFNWCCYGNNGHQERPEGSVLINYTKRENGVTPYTKVIIRSEKIPYQEIYKKSSHPLHHDYSGLDKNLNLINVLGEDMKNYYDNFPNNSWPMLNSDDRRQKMLSIAYIAHFTMKSDVDFDRRVKRGTQGDFGGEKVWGTFSQEKRSEYHAMTNQISDFYLHDYWTRQIETAWDFSIFPRCRWNNISNHKSATQISTAHDGTIEEDAARVLSGNICGKSQNHTALENDPWWTVDFGNICRVHEMRLFNRLDGVLERVANFVLHGSLDGQEWVQIMRKNDDIIYGGADGHPFIWVDQSGIQARFLRITILGQKTYLHFDQVQFFGEKIS